MRCSFCHKSQDAVATLISSPSGYRRAYICDECITVCASILDDDRAAGSASPVSAVDDVMVQPHLHSDRLLKHPLAPLLLDALERWFAQESSGVDAAAELAEVRSIAARLMPPKSQE